MERREVEWRGERLNGEERGGEEKGMEGERLKKWRDRSE